MSVLIFSGTKEYPCDVCVGLKVEGVQNFPLHIIEAESISFFCDSLMEFCQRFQKVDVLVDLSVLDKAFYEKGIVGGLSSRELLYILKRLKMMKNFSGFRFEGEGELVSVFPKSF
jgi:hypothetical protein